jgi:hypothetical protein
MQNTLRLFPLQLSASPIATPITACNKIKLFQDELENKSGLTQFCIFLALGGAFKNIFSGIIFFV